MLDAFSLSHYSTMTNSGGSAGGGNASSTTQQQLSNQQQPTTSNFTTTSLSSTDDKANNSNDYSTISTTANADCSSAVTKQRQKWKRVKVITTDAHSGSGLYIATTESPATYRYTAAQDAGQGASVAQNNAISSYGNNTGYVFASAQQKPVVLHWQQESAIQLIILHTIDSSVTTVYQQGIDVSSNIIPTSDSSKM